MTNNDRNKILKFSNNARDTIPIQAAFKDWKLNQLEKYLWLSYIDDMKKQVTAQLLQCCHPPN